jgi:hypothetical protein
MNGGPEDNGEAERTPPGEHERRSAASRAEPWRIRYIRVTLAARGQGESRRPSPYDAALDSIASVERTYSIEKARRELGFAPDPERCPIGDALSA